ncbi:MAG: DUF11 domain-containing protein [Candidatus Brocadiaceae bacterium]|nr:DUF11 domain-containing protein [Candidatus Brocadiaceae bacterium]
MDRRIRNFLTLSIFLFALGAYGCGYKGSIYRNDAEEYSVSHNTSVDDVRNINLARTESKQHGSLSLEKTIPVEVQINQPLDYRLKITNITDARVNDVEIYEILSHKYKLTNSFPKLPKGIENNIAKWDIGYLDPHETKIIQIFGMPVEEGDIPFCTEVKYALPPICAITSVVQPVLSIVKHAPLDVILCDSILVSYIVKNSGTGAAKNVEIKESLPRGLRTTDGETKVIRRIGTLGPGESRKIAVSVRADKTGTFDNAATIVADGDLTAQSNSTNTIVRQPVLEITKKGPDKRYVGGIITYDILVINKGDGLAASTIVEDLIPINTSYVSSTGGGTLSGNKVSWNLGAVKPDESKRIEVTVRANSIGKAKNHVTASADCAQEVFATTVTNVLGIPAILLEVIDVEDPIAIGANETYVITVTNQGSETSTNIRISCTLEEGMEYISSSGPTSGSTVGKSVNFLPLTNLAPKAEASWKVVVKAIKKGDVRFKVTMIDDRLDRPVEETEATYFYE